jgi:hypothetical protein
VIPCPTTTFTSVKFASFTAREEIAMAESDSFVRVGNGLIEIAALTALIGSSTAESLTLGNRGAAGLAWAAMSTFGALSVVKGCIAGATPDWLRETLGVRNANTDSAVGLSLDLWSKYESREGIARKNLGEAVGVVCEVQLVCSLLLNSLPISVTG